LAKSRVVNPRASESFWARVNKNGGTPSNPYRWTPSMGECWIWTGFLTNFGYGQAWNGARMEGAHRISYRDANGDIEPGMHVDHLCRNKSCVNPDHLEAVTQTVNNERNPEWAGNMERCGSGRHERPLGNKRGCSDCKKEYMKKYYRENKEKWFHYWTNPPVE